ncbi:MAG: dTDP-glucose 4,6-dehydratase [archaeon]|nr:dTDP-glucose 4,6-dehydratase [archaeon]
MKILVTGGLGFIGSNFITYFLQKHPEDSIVNLDKRTYAASAIAYEKLAKFPNYSFVLGDICDNELVLKLTKDIDAIVHFAAESHVDRSIEDLDPFVKTNILGTLNLLKAAHENKVKRLHHISTDEVFGSLDLDSREKFSEKTRYNPRNPYSASKASSDFFVNMYHETYGLETTITNCSNNFGPYQHPEKLIPKAILNLFSDKPVPIYGDGKNVRDWLYVEDHCSAIDLVLREGEPGESYCVSAGNEVSNIELVNSILQIMGKSNDLIKFVPDRPGHDRRYAIDATKIMKELGWKSKHTFRESLAKTIEWYKENRTLLAPAN